VKRVLRLMLHTYMNDQYKFASRRIRSRRSGYRRPSNISRTKRFPSRSPTKNSGRTKCPPPTDAAVSRVRSFMIRLGWIRLFHAIVLENYELTK
jgi:hypothetical protein